MKTFALALCAAGVSAITEVELEYFNYLAKFGKTIASTTEFLERVENFAVAHHFIKEHNTSNASFSVAHNQFSDWSDAEYKAILGAMPTYNEDREYLSFEPTNASSVNWVTAGAVTGVKDQGVCGSCWSFSATGALEGAHFLASGKLESFSEQQLVSCDTSSYGCNGGYPDYALGWFEKNKAELESVYPYTSGNGRTGTCQYDQHSTTSVNTSTYGYVTPDSVSSMMNALAKQPLSILIEADKMVFQYYSSGVLNDTRCGTNLDHAVLAVGYGTENGQDYWLVKNSWNTTWGDKGYIKIARVDGKGICGVQMQPVTSASN